MNEIWKDIPEYEGLYQVSSEGRVKSLAGDREVNGRIYHIRRDRILESQYGEYPFVVLSKNNITKQYLVHRLVLTSFFGSGDGLQVNHKNGIKSDNRLENLEWCTAKENIRHAWETGLSKMTEDHKRKNSISLKGRRVGGRRRVA